MNELEIREKSAIIHEASQEISIHSQSNLESVVEILKGVKQHRKKIENYWETAKTAANKAYSAKREDSRR